jgi:hypothetical protein
MESKIERIIHLTRIAGALVLLAGISWAGNACLKNWTDYLYHIPKV